MNISIKTLKRLSIGITLLLAMTLSLNTTASEHLMLTRTSIPFEHTKEHLKTVLEDNGYTVAHEQRCDGGLQKMGYESDSYRVLFFGKLEEVRKYSEKHETLIPFFPFKVVVYADGEDSVVTFLNPQHMKVLVDNDPEFAQKVDQWESDFKKVLEEVVS